MPRLMIASSPVEIEVKAVEAGFLPDAHDMARRMFHEMTDHLSQAAIALGTAHEDWPNHRFYFGTEGAEMSALIDGLTGRSDLLDVTSGTDNAPATVAGIYIQRMEGMFIGVLVGHQPTAL